MTPERLRAIRKSACPGRGGQGAFARALGYTDPRAYRRYESEISDRPMPALLIRVAEMIEAHGLPGPWRQPERNQENKT